MSDDNNQKSRGPRKGGGAGGKGGGFRGGGEGRGPGRGRSAPAGQGRPFRGRSEDERPRRGAAPAGERPARRFDRPAGRREEASRSAREGGERTFRARAEDEQRSPRAGAGPRSASRRFERPNGERPAPSRPGEERPRRPRREDEAPREVARILPSEREPERIAKVMARAGVASRRDSEAMIEEGRVSVNGTVIESPALDVRPDDVILVDGEPLPARERTRLWLYHKPRGLVTTNHDPEGRPTVFEALPEELPRVLSIGRLDINTEGLLLLTNDGGLARMLELPETGWLRRYRVRAFGSVTQDRLDTLSQGVTIDGVAYGPVIARFEREQGSNTWLTVDLREGKNREVKTVLEHLGLAVNRLIRVSFGPFQLGELEEGEVEEIRSRVLRDQLGEELMAKAGTDFEAPRRDEMPVAPRRAPAGDDRPRRREGSAAGRGPSHDERSDKPWKRTVWRDAEAEPQRERRAPPRRGADPREARQTREASRTLQRQRAAPIADPKGRRVLVERVSATDREESPARNQRAERSGPAQRVKRSERGAAERGSGERGGERHRPERAAASERPARRFGGRPNEDQARGRSFGERPGGARPTGERPAGRGPGGKPGGRPFRGKPGGRGGPRPGGGRGKRD